MGAYDRYELKLGKKTTAQTAPLTKEIIQTDQEITFEADFITPRIDKKQLQVTYHITEKSFGFIIQ